MAWKLVLVALMGLAIGALLGMLILRASRKREERRRQAARHLDVLENLSILCRALLQEQVDSAEASIRISVLLDCLPQGIEPKVDLAAIHRLTGGIPRAIGRVCDLSLLVGFADGLREIRAEEIHDVSLELPRAALKRVS